VSILVVGAAGELGEAVIARLVEQGDQVRVIESSSDAAMRWRTAGAHVARGDSTDDDLVERAAIGARTLVVLSDARTIGPVLDGSRQAGVDRVIACLPDDDAVSAVAAAGMDYVILRAPRARWSKRRPSVTPQRLAAAIDAADDLPSNQAGLRLDLDLGTAEAWAELGLDDLGGVFE
jgi:Trk K+ transport system NAD-binding subunit